MNTKKCLKKIPKVELHRHLDCSMRFSTMVDIAKSLGLVNPKSEEELNQFRADYLITEPFKDLAVVLKKFGWAQKLLKSENILERLVFECVEDMFNDGIRVGELRYSPNFIQGANPLLSFEQIHSSLCIGLEKALKQYPMAVGMIVIVQRTLDLPSAKKVLEFVFNRPKYVYGIDMADDENRDAKPFRALFSEAKKRGFKLTMHAGEMPTQKSIDNISMAINEFDVDRIGHGVQSYQDEKTCNLLIAKKIPLELCPTSNVLTQAVLDLKHHPVRKLYDRGILVTVSTDDPGIFDLDLTGEYEKLEEVHGFTEKEFLQMNKVAFEASFIPIEIKNKFKDLFK
jgi:adenosine deaminase